MFSIESISTNLRGQFFSRLEDPDPLNFSPVVSLFQKEEQITKLEVRLRKGGVPLESIRKISLAMASKRAQGTSYGSTPTLNINGDRCVPW